MRLRLSAPSPLVRHQDTLAANSISLRKRRSYPWTIVISPINVNAATGIMRIGEVVRAVMRMSA
jgi:hypothetical protein